MSTATNTALTKLATAAFKQAAERVIKMAEETGTPVILWINGQVTAVPPAKLRPKLGAKRKKRGG